MLRSFKFRLYPARQQKVILQSWLSECRNLYNEALAERKNAWEKTSASITCYMQLNNLPGLKQTKPALAGVHSQVLQDTLRRVDKAFKNFYSRMKKGQKPGYPRFKHAGRYNSFTFPQSGFELEGKKLLLSKIGPINIKRHRQINGMIKTCTIKQEAGKWHAIFTADLQPAPQTAPRPTTAIGIDAGLVHIITLSTGETVAHPKFYKKAEQRLAFEQRHLSRKKKGSKNRMKQKLQIQNVHMKIANKRQDFLHKLSRQLVSDYGIIAYENLEIQNMQMKTPARCATKLHNSATVCRCRGLSKSIADASWGILMRMLDYKVEEAGSQVIKVDAGYTSQMCSRCGAVAKKMLSERTHSCTSCGLVMDRDHNAAINILKKGLGKIGQELPEATPVGDAQKEALSMKQEASTFRWG